MGKFNYDFARFIFSNAVSSKENTKLTLRNGSFRIWQAKIEDKSEVGDQPPEASGEEKE